MTQLSNYCTKGAICRVGTLAFLFLASVGVIVGYIYYNDHVSDEMKSATKICSTNDENFDDAFTTTSQETISWVYNVTNPFEYLSKGATAEVHELGGFSYDMKITRTNPRFSEGGDRILFTQYVSGRFNPSKSAPGLDITDEIYSINVAYLAVLGNARHEAMLMLAATCTRPQLGTMGNTNVPVCLSEQVGNESFVCQCCSPSPLENSTTCSDIASPTSTAGGLISFLSMLDGGVKMSDEATAFPLSSGVYSPLVTKKTVSQLISGTSSSLLGVFRYQLGGAEDKVAIGNATEDMVDACAPLGYCPTLPELLVQLEQASSLPQIIGMLKQLDCSGLIPDTEGLVDAGVEESRAEELRYLEGVDCRPYTSTLISSALIVATDAPYTCAKGSLPCCLSSYTIPGMGEGAGLGCLMFISGAVIMRQVYSVEEAYNGILPSPDIEVYTGCADNDDAYNVISWQGRQEINHWFVPDSYSYPNMPWADPSIKPISPAGGVAGAMNKGNASGITVAARKGRGVTSKFLDYKLTDGAPIDKNETVFLPRALASKTLLYVESSDVDGVPTNDFEFLYLTNYSEAEDEARQVSGEMPYANLVNMRFKKGAPAISSLPNFLDVDERILSQLDNSERHAADGCGVSLYKTRNGYHRYATLQSSPELMTKDSVASERSEFVGRASIEPATGVSLRTRAQNMGSAYTWNCNPQLDPSCGFMASAHNASDPLCYIFGNGKQMPCGATNVFTPRVHGGKVLPLFWTRVILEPVASSKILLVMDIRYALAVLSVIFPVLLVIASAVFCILARKSRAADDVKVNPEQSDTAVGGTELYEIEKHDASGDVESPIRE